MRALQESDIPYTPPDDWVEAEIQDGWARVRPEEEDAPTVVARRIHVGAVRRQKIGEVTKGTHTIPIYTYARPEAVEAFDEGSGNTTFMPPGIVENLSDHRVHLSQLPEIVIWKAPPSDPAETDVPLTEAVVRRTHMTAGKPYKTLPQK